MKVAYVAFEHTDQISTDWYKCRYHRWGSLAKSTGLLYTWHGVPPILSSLCSGISGIIKIILGEFFLYKSTRVCKCRGTWVGVKVVGTHTCCHCRSLFKHHPDKLCSYLGDAFRNRLFPKNNKYITTIINKKVNTIPSYYHDLVA